VLLERRLPRFYLHVCTPRGLIEDSEGAEFTDYTTAIVEAVRGARCLMSGEVAAGALCLDQSIEIYDAAGAHLTTVPFTEAVTLVHTPDRDAEAGTANARL
jgi:hypothetical protein